MAADTVMLVVILMRTMVSDITIVMTRVTPMIMMGRRMIVTLIALMRVVMVVAR